MQPTSAHILILKKLWDLAQRNSGQSRVIAKFLLGIYDGERFPFDLTDFRSLDADIFQMCLSALTWNYSPPCDLHTQLGHESYKFERLAREWSIPNRSFD